MQTGNQVFWTVLSLSLSGTLIGILILCIRPFTKKFFSKKWNYYVWLVMVARLLIPFSLGINVIGSLFAMGDIGNAMAGERGTATGNLVKEEFQNAGTAADDGELPEALEPAEPCRA